MRILTLLSTFFQSGQTTHVVTLCGMLKELGHDVTLVVTHPHMHKETTRQNVRYLRKIGVTVHTTEDFQRQVQVASTNPFDIIHAHSSWDFRQARDLSKVLGIKYVLTCHGLGLYTAKNQPYMEEAARLICPGRRVFEDIEPLTQKAVIIPNAVHIRRFRPERKGKPLGIIYAGRSDSAKLPGIKALVQAVERLPMEMRFAVAGTHQLKPLVGKRGRYKGWRLRMERFFNTADIVIGTGRTIREGMASGCACLVLGKNYGGLVLPDLLPEDGLADFSGGSHLGSEPDADAICDDLMMLASKRGLLRKTQSLSRNYATRHFDLQRATERTVKLYQEVVGEV